MFLGRARGVIDMAVPLPKGSEVRRGNIPIPPHDPWDSSQDCESLLESVQENPAIGSSLRGGARRTVDREEVESLGASPRDNSVGAPVDSGATMYLKRPSYEDRGAAAAALVATGVGRVPNAMPTRLTSHELQTLEAGAKVAMFLKEKDSPGLM